jgi:hypothetical protein
MWEGAKARPNAKKVMNQFFAFLFSLPFPGMGPVFWMEFRSNDKGILSYCEKA